MTDPLEELLDQLVRIDSQNPDLVPGAVGEAAAADFVTAWLEARGFTCHRLESTPGRPSVVGVHTGTGGGRSIMLNGHLDIVSLVSYDGDGLVPVVRDGRMYGRGTYDMKAGVAAAMVAAADVAERPHRGDVVVALVADEEYASLGTQEVLRAFDADAAIVVEPSDLAVVPAHHGFMWFDVTIHGRAAHGSRRDQGLDAIAKAGRFLTAVADWDVELSERKPHPLLGTPNVHTSLIRGGEELSSYPAWCTVSLERRTLPGEDSASVEAELRAVLDRIAGADPDFVFDLVPGLVREPFGIDVGADVVRSVVRAVTEETGAEPTVRGDGSWNDTALLAEAGIPCVMFGPAGDGAHAAQEWVDLRSLETVTNVLRRVVRDHVG